MKIDCRLLNFIKTTVGFLLVYPNSVLDFQFINLIPYRDGRSYFSYSQIKNRGIWLKCLPEFPWSHLLPNI